MYTKAEVARTIDHAVLKPTMTDADVIGNAAMCRERGVGCLCVRSCDVELAALELAGSSTITAAVIGFPHGNSRPEVKALEARLAIEDGARELDMVMNISKFLSGDHEMVQADIEAVVAEAKPKGVPVKVILESCLLTLEQVAEACKLAEAGGADFVKTSTGFADGGATPEAIEVMLKTVGETMKVKASGGIRTWETAVGYLERGCERLGIGSTEAVLDGGEGDGDY
ncbi:MAG: deoxyribose-phosphate aldolase [Lentisphaerae bacterium]|nr:deoxyribose-phosphate aldolase [Lentisphaerota bacterium]